MFGETPEFGTPGARSCREVRAFTAAYEFTEFSVAVTTNHLSEGLEVEVSLLGDQPQRGFVRFPFYRELHPRPGDDESPAPEYVLGLEAQVMADLAARLERLLLHA
jgi:hypothetical protein